MFKPISNPYIVGNPIKTSEMFFGRQDDFDFIKRKLESGQKSYIIVLCGERRSGKTSILFQILSGCLGEEFIPVLIDMQAMAGLKNEREFFEKCANETLKCIDDKLDIETFFKEADSSFKGFSAFLEEIHKRNPQKHLLFLVDEYELIEAKISEGSLNENLIPYLAGLLEGEQLISFLFTGSTSLEDRDTKLWQILFAKSLFRNVSYLSRDDSLRLITEPVKGRISFETEVLNTIYRLTFGQPFYTQVVCQNIVDYVNEKQLNQIQLEDLEVVVGEILENPLPQMIYFWNSLSDDKKLVLSLLAEILERPEQRIKAEDIIKESRQRKFGLDLTIKSINMSLEGLFHSQYVSKTDAGFNLQMDLFRRWIKRDHAIWRVMKEVSSLGLASSVVDQVYHNDGSPGTAEKPKKWLVPTLVGLVIIIVAGWWLLTTGPDISQDKIEEAANQQETIPAPKEKTNADGDNAAMKKSNAPLKNNLKNEVVEIDEPQKKIKKPVNFPADKKKSSKKTTPQKKPDLKKIDKFAEGNAHAARKAMLATKDRATIGQADKYAPQLFARATEKEESANLLLSQNQFKSAEEGFFEAENLFEEALKAKPKVDTKGKEEADIQRNNLNSVKKKLLAQHSKFNSYKKAKQKELQATTQYTDGAFKQAALGFKQAASAYSSVINDYKEAGKIITGVINKYLDAMQNENIAGMKKYHSNFTADLEKDWQQLFDFAENLKVGRSYKKLDISEHNARVSIEVSLKFDKADKQINNWQVDLKKSGSRWMITHIGDGSAE
jgi:hypothetical protein